MDFEAFFAEYLSNGGATQDRPQFLAGWRACAEGFAKIADEKWNTFSGYAWDSGAGSSGYDKACVEFETIATKLSETQ